MMGQRGKKPSQDCECAFRVLAGEIVLQQGSKN